ncbi:MAG: hypothetical protein GX792_02535 [Bacteroidales bacterium]|nr:hypothetical protein [Bacteroidales bacterium]
MGGFRSFVLFAGLSFLPALLFAQFNNNTSSPYSRFGIGDLQPYSFGRSVAMGGASLASRNAQQINISNPASYTAQDSLVFMFEFGLSGKFANYSNDIASKNANDVNFRYFAMNFQITNWMATSLGLTPYSDVGYDVIVNDKIENAGDVIYRYSGEGSLSRAYLGFAVEPVKNFSVGANFNYLFGLLNRNSETFFLESSDFYNNFKYESMRLRDFSIGLGIQATLPLKENQKINFAAVLDNKPKYTGFSSNLTQKVLSIQVGNSSRTDQDTIKFQNQEQSSIKFPMSLGFGLSYVNEHKLEVNADYYMQTWSKAKFFGETNPILTDLSKFAVGAEWVPDKFSIRSFINRIAYRAGAKYENSYLLLGDQQIKDYGITFGVGLPIYRSNSTINVSAELGRRGTKKNNLVLENYAKLNLSVNLYDLWFIKRRFD